MQGEGGRIKSVKSLVHIDSSIFQCSGFASSYARKLYKYLLSWFYVQGEGGRIKSVIELSAL